MIWSRAQVGSVSTFLEIERLGAMAEYWQSDVPKSTVNHNRTNNCGIVQFHFLQECSKAKFERKKHELSRR